MVLNQMKRVAASMGRQADDFIAGLIDKLDEDKDGKITRKARGWLEGCRGVVVVSPLTLRLCCRSGWSRAPRLLRCWCCSALRKCKTGLWQHFFPLSSRVCMFRHEVAERAAAERAARKKSDEPTLLFKDWNLFQRAKETGALPALDAGPAQSAPSALTGSVPPVAAAREAEPVEDAGKSWVAVASGPAASLSGPQTMALLKNLLHLGEDRNFMGACETLDRLASKANASPQNLLCYALALHQVRVHFSGPHVWSISTHAAQVVNDVLAIDMGTVTESRPPSLVFAHRVCSRHPGPYVVALVETLAASLVAREGGIQLDTAMRDKGVKRLEELNATSPCYLTGYLLAVHVQMATGSVLGYPALVKKAAAEPNFMSAAGMSWCYYRVGMYDLASAKKPATKDPAKAKSVGVAYLQEAVKHDVDGNGARELALVSLRALEKKKSRK